MSNQEHKLPTVSVEFLKKGLKKPIFKDTIRLSDLNNDISIVLADAFLTYKKIPHSAISHFEIEGIQLKPYNISNLTHDDLYFINGEISASKAYFKDLLIMGSAIRYANKIDSQFYLNNRFPKWNYLSDQFSITLTLNFNQLEEQNVYPESLKNKYKHLFLL